jgi:hypothetical protein
LHTAQISVGAFSGTGVNDMGVSSSATSFAVSMEASFLFLPSPYGNYHGLEAFTTLRTGTTDFNLGLGFPITLLNLGSGNAGTVRAGVSFGMVWGNIHSWLYVKPRVAVVVVPDKIDVEIASYYSPVEVSSNDIEMTNSRISAWYRYSSSSRNSKSVQFYLESFRRAATPVVGMTARPKDLTGGLGLGVGWTF